MRRSLLIGALLATTALTPTDAKAAPVVGWVAGAVGVSSGAAAGLGIAVGSGTAFATGAAFALTAVGGFVVRTGLALGLSAIAQKLAPKPPIPTPAAQMVNYAQTISFAERVYGRTRKGGPLAYTAFGNNRRYYVPILAAHPIQGIVEHFLDERSATLTAEADPNLSNLRCPITVSRCHPGCRKSALVGI